jgi:hypothetical protein
MRLACLFERPGEKCHYLVIRLQFLWCRHAAVNASLSSHGLYGGSQRRLRAARTGSAE